MPMRRFTIVLMTLLLAAGVASAQPMREATKLSMGKTTHFTIEKAEQKDFAIQFGQGDYYIVLDLKREDNAFSNIMGKVQLLKTTGSMVEDGFLYINELHVVGRVGKKFHMAKPLAARLRMFNEGEPLEAWMTVLPAPAMKFISFGYDAKGPLPLGIGSNEGKGGQLAKNQWAHHTIKLPAGKWDLSVYFKQIDGANTNLMGQVDLLDQFGFRDETLIYVNQIGVEGREEKTVTLAKPRTLILRVINTNNPVEYVVGILKASQ